MTATANSEPNEEPNESVEVPVPGPRRIRRAARSVKRNTVAFATHPYTTNTVKAVGRGTGIVAIAVVSATAHGMALGYSQNRFGSVTVTPTLRSVAPAKAVKVA